MQMKKIETLNINFMKRVLVFIVGLCIMAFGVSFSVKAGIGVSPISCVPYIYSLYFSLSIGEFTILLNAIFMLIQIAILRKKYKLIQLVQLPALIFFGYCIDITMSVVKNLNPSNYMEQFILCILSCIVLAFGIFLVVKTRLTYLPLEGLVMVITQTFKKEFGTIKISMDSLMVIIGVTSSIIFFYELVGIREGSIIAALLIGALIKFFSIRLVFMERWIMGESSQESESTIVNHISNNYVITISREYGSGGHEIAQTIAKELGITFYDKELIELTAQKTGYTPDYIQQNEQTLSNSLLYDLYEQNYAYVNDEMPPKDALFLVQSKIIREICAKESCVIVGRCANFILKDYENCINIFIHANVKYRVEKINNEYSPTKNVTWQDLKDFDEKRANYCMYFTHKNWKDATNYHLSLDSSLYGTKENIQKIIELIHSKIDKKV